MCNVWTEYIEQGRTREKGQQNITKENEVSKSNSKNGKEEAKKKKKRQKAYHNLPIPFSTVIISIIGTPHTYAYIVFSTLSFLFYNIKTVIKIITVDNKNKEFNGNTEH